MLQVLRVSATLCRKDGLLNWHESLCGHLSSRNVRKTLVELLVVEHCMLLGCTPAPDVWDYSKY